jgi:hypothetical protein
MPTQLLVAKIKTQHGKTIHEFQIDAGCEFKSTELTEFLKELGVNILTSIPHIITIFLFDFTFTLLFFVIYYLIPLIPGHESPYL